MKIILQEEHAVKDRLKALELLGKSYGDYIDNFRFEGTVTLEKLVTMAIEEKDVTPVQIEQKATVSGTPSHNPIETKEEDSDEQ